MAIDLRAAIQAKLEPHSLPVYVAGLRAAGRTWDMVAADLKDRTGIAVSRETLRVWFGESPSQKETAAILNDPDAMQAIAEGESDLR